MSRTIRYIELDAMEKQTLEEGVQNHPKAEFRKHCQMLLFSAKGKTAQEIALLLESNYQSVINCFNNWEQKGLVGLMRSRGQGRKATLSQVDEGKLKIIISEHRQSARKATAQLEKEFSLKVHPQTLRRFLKSISTLSVACVTPKSKQDSIERQTQEAQLSRLWQLYKQQEINLFFGDESTLSMDLCLTYGWQAKGEAIGILPRKDKKINLLGFFQTDNTAINYQTKANMNSAFIIVVIIKLHQVRSSSI